MIDFDIIEEPKRKALDRGLSMAMMFLTLLALVGHRYYNK